MDVQTFGGDYQGLGLRDKETMAKGSACQIQGQKPIICKKSLGFRVEGMFLNLRRETLDGHGRKFDNFCPPRQLSKRKWLKL